MKLCKPPKLIRNKILLLFILVFFLFPFFAFSKTDPGLKSFQPEVQKQTDQFLRGRDGVILWLDKDQDEKMIFGNSRLLDEKFLPGSLMKLMVAELALDKKVDFHYRCKGSDKILNQKRFCWNSKGHGTLDLPNALSLSCNLFFSNLALKIGVKSLLEKIRDYHFSESPKLFQNESELNRHVDQLAIGDFSFFQVSPLEIFNFWNQYLQQINDKKYTAIEQALLRVVSEGTASRSFVTKIQILGKTGTGDSLQKNYKTNGWFLAAYPVVSPRYLLLVFLKDAHGFREPVQLANYIFSIAEKEGILQKSERGETKNDPKKK